MTCSQIDFHAKLWTCPFCGQRNHFPPEYAQGINETSLPYEVMPSYTTVEYEIQGRQSIPPVFLLVIDTTVDAKELSSLKDSLQQNLAYLPDNALVGIISFGTHVEVHELSQTDISRSYVFNGTKVYPTSKVADMLGLRGSVAQAQVVSTAGVDGRSAARPLLLASFFPMATARRSLIRFSASWRKILWSRSSPLIVSGPWWRSIERIEAPAALSLSLLLFWRSCVRSHLHT